ncbi:MAG TPA: hypothetical protein VGH80_07550 [Xanthomonadaceae bacterium]|jgi:hypothetical protein
MSFLALLLYVSAAAASVASPHSDSVPEVTFDSIRYCLPLANNLRFDIPKVDSRLVDEALADAGASGKKVSFQKALARKRSGTAYYVFTMRQFFDIYLVYETDPQRKTLIRKFRYFSKYEPCALPWPPEV